MKKRKETNLIIVFFIILILFLAVYFYQDKLTAILFKNSESVATEAEKTCLKDGGTLKSRTRGDNTAYSVCIFEDNRQCEIQALQEGDCPKGGLKVTGYITDAAVYCAIIGGKYQIDDDQSNGVENGTCSFFNGTICNVWDLYNGKCDKGSTDKIDYNNSEYNFSLKLPITWEDKYAVSETTINNIKYVSFDYLNNVANLFKIAIVPASIWDKQTSLKSNYLGRDNSNFFALVYSTDPLKSSQSVSGDYMNMLLDVDNIKATFEITKPYIFSESRKEKGSNYSINILYPFVGGIESVNVNLEINNLIETIVSQFKDLIAASDAWQGENTFKIFYDPYEINSDFVSIRFETDVYTGGAHSENVSYSFNYDFKNDKVLSLADLFKDDYISVLSVKAIDYLSKLNKEEEFTNEDWIKEGAGASEGNFKTFTFNKDVITFYFNPYQIGPYAAGMQQVIIPWANLKDILNDSEVKNLNLNI